MVFTIMAKQRILVCPICGETQPETKVCRTCSTLLDPDGLLLAEGGIGPWWVRNEELPFRPGITYEQVADLAKNGKIDLQTILRGPTTRQLWKVARRVNGVAHLLGRCHSCGEHVLPDDRMCSGCNAPFLRFPDRNNMGLELGVPSRGEASGMSSFLSDAEIMDTQSEPLTLPSIDRHPNPTTTATSEEDTLVGSPQFRALQRQLEKFKRRSLVLTVVLVVVVVVLLGLVSSILD